MIAIIDYKVGNLFSLKSSLLYLEEDCVITDDPVKIADAKRIILPGVGAFPDARASLKETGLDAVVLREIEKGKPVMGICLGMQLLYEESCEYGKSAGLGLIPGKVEDLSEKLSQEGLKIPHMGWNSLVFKDYNPLLKYLKVGEYVYYVHSYYAEASKYTVAYSEYGSAKVTGIVAKDNVYGTQFHPEKSGETGLRLLKAFCEIE